MLKTLLFLCAVWMCVVAALPVSAQEPSAAALKQANNPLANMKAINFQNYYVPQLYGLPELTANTFWVRAVFPVKRWIFRASLPLPTVPTSSNVSMSGLGDFNIFGAYLITQTAEMSFGVGPLLALPTADEDALGTGKVQLGAAAVVFNASSAAMQYGGLVTMQFSVAGDDDRQDTASLAIQPFGMWQLGKGTYLRTAPVYVFDLENGYYNVPFSVGIGRISKVERIVYNMFIEPQWTILHYGTGQPGLQIFAGINIQITK